MLCISWEEEDNGGQKIGVRVTVLESSQSRKGSEETQPEPSGQLCLGWGFDLTWLSQTLTWCSTPKNFILVGKAHPHVHGERRNRKHSSLDMVFVAGTEWRRKSGKKWGQRDDRGQISGALGVIIKTFPVSKMESHWRVLSRGEVLDFITKGCLCGIWGYYFQYSL